MKQFKVMNESIIWSHSLFDKNTLSLFYETNFNQMNLLLKIFLVGLLLL